MPGAIEDAEAVILVLAQPGPELGSQLGLLGQPQQCRRVPITVGEEIACQNPDTRFAGGDRRKGLVCPEHELKRSTSASRKASSSEATWSRITRSIVAAARPRDGEDRGGDQRPGPDPVPDVSARPV